MLTYEVHECLNLVAGPGILLYFQLKGRGMRRKIATFAAGVFMAAGVVFATAAPAQAAVCNWSHSNLSDGTAVTHGSGVNYRGGGNTGCDPRGSWNSGSNLYLHCWSYGSQVGPTQIWWYARKSGTSQEGFISAYYLNNSSYVQTPYFSVQC